MNREIKLRCWYKKYKEYFFRGESLEELFRWFNIAGGYNKYKIAENKEGLFVWQRFTGLKDKNGKEMDEKNLKYEIQENGKWIEISKEQLDFLESTECRLG